MKLIQTATEILKAEYMNSLEATLSTFLERKVLMIQTITNKMTLSSLSLLNAEQYKVVELRSAEIPLNWDDRSNWLRMFELLATVIVRNVLLEDIFYFTLMY